MSFFKTAIVGFCSGVAGGALLLYVYVTSTPPTAINHDHPYSTMAAYRSTRTPNIVSTPASTRMTSYANNIDFSEAASRSIESVVYVNSISKQGSSYSYWDLLFNNVPMQSVSSGSGVIFSRDGYIITNNHVVESADKIQVVYKKRAYSATLVGTDPSTDLAVLKIEAKNPVPMSLGNSKKLLVGEWVIAVGNPFSLSSTVTAGIVSAKGRRINIVKDKFPIESFIQTDAAINPGNSGGALVDKNGELVGINTAILSRTGSYTGYAFAVPVDIVKKVFHDIVSYGCVQKPFFGADIEEYDFQNVKKYRLNTRSKKFNGVLLTGLEKSGAADQAKLKLGDIIIKFQGVNINSKSQFEEELSYHSPGDTIRITYIRDGKEHTTTVILLNQNKQPQLVTRKLYDAPGIGATLEAVEYGVKVVRIRDGLFKQLNLPENYIIISINRHRVEKPQEVIDFFDTYKGRVILYGITNKNQHYPISFYLK